MRVEFGIGAVLLWLAVWPDQGLACSQTRDFFNNPMTRMRDCSFTNADTEAGEFGRDKLSEGKAYDRGDGRVAQRVIYGSGCTTVEWLVFTECETGKAIAIKGTQTESAAMVGGYIHESVSEIQPPNGPIRASRTDSVDSLAKQALAHNLISYVKSESDNDPNGLGAFWLWQKYPANCGCKLFYPESVGAVE